MSCTWKCPMLRAAFMASLMVTSAASMAKAQAYTPARGEGAVSLLYQDLFVKNHYFGTTPNDAGQITSRLLVADVTYGVTDKLAVNVGIPWIASRYNGT